MIEFYADWNNGITTNIPWKTPTIPNIKETWNSLKDIYNFDGYNVYIAGGYAEYYHNSNNPKTMDLDLCFIPNSEELDYSQIKGILDDSAKIGFQNRLLIDAKFVPKITWDLFRKLHTNYSPTQNELDNCWYITNWISFTKTIGDRVDVNFVKNPIEYTEVSEGLYKFTTKKRIIEKVKRKIRDGLYTDNYINLKSDEFNLD